MPRELGYLIVPTRATAPAATGVGQIYYDSGTSIMYYWNGSAWTAMSGGGGGAVLSYVSQEKWGSD